MKKETKKKLSHRYQKPSIQCFMRLQKEIVKQFSNSNEMQKYDYFILRSYEGFKVVTDREELKKSWEKNYFVYPYGFAYDEYSMDIYTSNLNMRNTSGKYMLKFWCKRFPTEQEQGLLDF